MSCCHWTLENRFFIVNYGIRIAVHGSWKMDYAVNLVDSAIWILYSVIWIVHSVIWIVHYACGIWIAFNGFWKMDCGFCNMRGRVVNENWQMSPSEQFFFGGHLLYLKLQWMLITILLFIKWNDSIHSLSIWNFSQQNDVELL